MVGRALCQPCNSIGDEILAYDHRALDISDRANVVRLLAAQRPEAVINCAAWTDVDGCEKNKEQAFAANARGPENLARVCDEIKATLVTISTDYVFDGKKDGFY